MNGARRFILGVGLQIADCSNGAALVDGLLDLFGQADILHLHFAKLQPHRFKIGTNAFAQHCSHQSHLGFHIDDRDAQLGHHFLDTQADLAAKIFLNGVGGKAPIGTRDISDKNARVLDANRVDTERGCADNAEFLVAHRCWPRRAPLHVGEFARRDKIHFRLERRFKAVLPALERGQDWHVLRRERVHAGLVHVGQLAFVDKHRHLPFAYGELGPVLDLIVVSLEAIDERVI